MTTAITPRLQRAIDYATQEVFTVLPDGLPALMDDLSRMRRQDVPESVIVSALHHAVMKVIHLDELERVCKELTESLPPQ